MKKVLIIGASRGIGLEMSKQLCHQGNDVTATVRDPSNAQVIEYFGAKILTLDVSNSHSVSEFAKALKHETWDLVVYVAGVFGPRTDASQPVDVQFFDQVMHTNVLGAMQLITHLAPLIKPQTGQFVFISSLMASMKATDSSHGWIYKASKAALNMCVKSASVSYPNICMISISPGWVKTDMGGEFAPLTPSQSVKGILATIENLTLKDSGRFFNYNGESLAY